MVQTHLTVEGGEQWLSWAYGRARALRALGLPNMTKRWDMGDGTTVVVRIALEHTYIELKGTTGGGYAVTVQSDVYTPVEYSVIHDIREADGAPKPPPYKRRDNKYRTELPSYWVGGVSEKARKVSHIDLMRNTYVVGNEAAEDWGFPEYLVRVCFTNGVWVFIAARADLSGYVIRAITPETGQWGVVAEVDVGKDGTLRSNDLGNVDVSPDGTKFMMIWSAVDTNLGFVKARYVREYTFIPPSQPGRLPSLSAPGTDVNIMPVIVDNRQDNGRGSITTTTVSGHGYSWDNNLVHASFENYERYDAGTGQDLSEGPFLPDFPGILPPGSYDSTDGGRVVRNTITVPGGTYTKSSSSSASNTYVSDIFWFTPPTGNGGGGPVPIPWGPSSTGRASSSSEDMRLLYFDPRSGAYVTIEGVGSMSYGAVTTAANYQAGPTGTWSRTITFGEVNLKLHFGAQSKTWNLSPSRTQTDSGPYTANWGMHQYTNSPYPVISYVDTWAPYLKLLFASRRPGEGVFSAYYNTFKEFAVIGQKNGVPTFISGDKRGLKKFGEAGLVVTQIYPI